MSRDRELLIRALAHIDSIKFFEEILDHLSCIENSENYTRSENVHMDLIGELHPNGIFNGPLPTHLPFPIKLYAKPYPLKPMTDFREYFEEMHSQLEEDYGDNVHIFEAGFKQGARWVQLDHGPWRK